MGLDNVVGLIRNLMHLSAAVGDVGDEGSVPSLWSQLPKIVVVGGQVRSWRSAIAADASRRLLRVESSLHLLFLF